MRTGNFKMGRLHGVTKSSKGTDEREIENQLFHARNIRIEVARGKHEKIRLIGYEVPLDKSPSGSNRIDLLGYGENHRPYIIEIKREDSSDSIESVERQLTLYKRKFQASREYIENEIKHELFWPEFVFLGEPNLILLAPAKYYLKHIEPCHSPDIRLCTFGRRPSIRNEADDNINILSKVQSSGYVSLRLVIRGT